jgi:hypothetical protein
MAEPSQLPQSLLPPELTYPGLPSPPVLCDETEWPPHANGSALATKRAAAPSSNQLVLVDIESS